MNSAAVFVRVVLEGVDDETWQLRTSDFADFRSIFGERLLTLFCRCFIHADRIISLVFMLKRTLDEYTSDSVPGRRNFLSFFSFAAGTLKEYGLALENLRTELVRGDLWDAEEWNASLKRWEDWANDKDHSAVRNEMAFHIDADLIEKGLSSLATPSSRVLFRGQGGKNQDAWSEIAADSVLEGLRQSLGDLEATIESPSTLLDVHKDLQTLFVKVLERKGLRPIVLRVRGRRIPIQG
jgi:hypothetical protein